MSRKRQHAFTLVELLVVIGIIAILIAILLPSLNKARAQARTVVCQSNLRTVGQLMQFYMGDWKGSLPPNCARSQGGLGYWNIKVSYYVGNQFKDERMGRSFDDRDQKYHCPEWSVDMANAGMAPDARSYGMTMDWVKSPHNSVRAPANPDTGTVKSHQAINKKVKLPDQFVYVMDFNQRAFYNLRRHLATATVGTSTKAAYRHTKGANVLFLDWHVGYLKETDIITDASDPTDGMIKWTSSGW